ncbi:MAG: HD domain-containing protein [Hyphomicrobiaceae bacterium]|nr:HD domain-containing protein [Hyphomicrobiaceae bacterium]
MARHTKRLRDPVHGLIVFDMADEVDRAAWKLIDTPEFQRLRRVKQLGFSELVFPGATHNRFSHSIGVFHVARQLMDVAKPLIAQDRWSEQRRKVALLSALLHDLGHGPFSHAFEVAEQERLKKVPGAYKHHEAWTADIIRTKDGNVRNVLKEVFMADGAMADDIAALLTATPQDIYAAVVSSSFDADRLDYLQRDKLMTGSGAGGIDFDWLRDNLRVVKVRGESEGSVEGAALEVETFCFTEKASQAAEAFLLARYHLFSQVYYHKTTRGFERLLTAFLQQLALLIREKKFADSGLPQNHPLVDYYSTKTPTLRQYLELDDTVVWGALEAACLSNDSHLKALAQRLRNRKPMKPIEINVVSPTKLDRARREHIDQLLESDGGKTIYTDRPKLSVYADHRKEDVPLHKRVYIQRNDSSVDDIATLSGPIGSLKEPQEVLRYYFLDESVRKNVSEIGG